MISKTEYARIRPKMEGYVIYNPATGVFSSGGVTPRWGPRPKIWSSIGALKNHIGLFIPGKYWPGGGPSEIKMSPARWPYAGCVILDIFAEKEFDLTPQQIVEEAFYRLKDPAKRVQLIFD